jgi:hypothetical protein
MNANLDRIDQIQACIDVAESCAKEHGLKLFENDTGIVFVNADDDTKTPVTIEYDEAIVLLVKIAQELATHYGYSIHECNNGDIDVFNKHVNLTEQKDEEKKQ